MIHPLINAVRRIPTWAEIGIVTGVTFGSFIVSQWTANQSPDLGSGAVVFSDRRLSGLISWELLVLFALGFFLWARGWRWQDLTLSITWRQSKNGLWLWIGTNILLWVVSLIAVALIPSMADSAGNLNFRVSVSLPVIAVLSIVNPIYEELATIVYLFRRLSRLRPQAIVIVSASLRGMVHAYQGAFAMVMIVFLGLVWGCYYAKYRKLWPLVLAHGLMDFISLAVATSTGE